MDVGNAEKLTRIAYCSVATEQLSVRDRERKKGERLSALERLV